MNTTFLDYISTLDLEQLRECRVAINNKILEKLSPSKSNANNLSDTSDARSSSKSIDDLVEYKKDFITGDVRNRIKDEIKVEQTEKYEEVYQLKEHIDSALRNHSLGLARKFYDFI